jgi:hypothetical protein
MTLSGNSQSKLSSNGHGRITRKVAIDGRGPRLRGDGPHSGIFGEDLRRSVSLEEQNLIRFMCSETCARFGVLLDLEF